MFRPRVIENEEMDFKVKHIEEDGEYDRSDNA